MLAVSQGNILFSLLLFSVFMHNRALYRAFGFDPVLATRSPYGGPQPIIISALLYPAVTGPIDTLLSFAMNALTRFYEYQADEFAAQLEKTDQLSSALIRLHIDNLSSPHNDWLYSIWHHSHPTLPERLRAMKEYKPVPGRIKMKPDRESKKEL